MIVLRQSSLFISVFKDQSLSLILSLSKKIRLTHSLLESTGFEWWFTISIFETAP